jgi:D-mannonate dehydratase
MGNGIWSSGRSEVRGASAREFDMASPNKQGIWSGKTWREPLSHGRVYTEKEIWDNYTYFIKQVAPVAEEQGVRIGIHPDDPPVPVLAGVPRCIFSNFEGYKRALEIANMKALRDVNYDGIMILDHSPTMVGGRYTQTAYGVAYMKALLNRANAEAKK